MSRLRALDPNDKIALLALVLLTIGAGLIALPLAFVTPGVLLMLYAITASRRETAP